jgi:hypothetical protein
MPVGANALAPTGMGVSSPKQRGQLPRATLIPYAATSNSFGNSTSPLIRL